jgi:hypothetical protein
MIVKKSKNEIKKKLKWKRKIRKKYKGLSWIKKKREEQWSSIMIPKVLLYFLDI